MLGQTLKAVDHQPYMGITISETLNWKSHILDKKNIKQIRPYAALKGISTRVQKELSTRIHLLSETYPRIWKYCMGSLPDVSKILA